MTDLKAQYRTEKVRLEMLQDRLKPAYAELRKSHEALYLFPHLLPLRIEKTKGRRKNPVLICDYGMQEERPYGNHAKKLRTAITIDSKSNKYIIEEQGWIGQKRKYTKPDVYAWRNDRKHSRHSVFTFDLEEAVSYMTAEGGRIDQALMAHKDAKPKRIASGLGALALAALFSLTQCTDANAQEIEIEKAMKNKVEVLDNFDPKPHNANGEKHMTKPHNLDGPYAILEISSNTVHFSVFFPNGKITSMIDEKLKCGLGNYPEGTNNLNPEGVQNALNAIDDYKRNFMDHMDFKGFAAIGTGAMRDADDAPDFACELRDRYGIDLDVLSGEDEGYYAALGVVSAFDDANGVMFDQGGRSTEFAIIKDGKITDCISLPLGTFTIGEQKNPEKYIKKQLKTLPEAYWEQGFENLYVVGGSPRRVMKSHRKREIGLGGSIHGYSVPADEVQKLSKQVMGASRDELLEEFHISKKRVSLVPASAQLMRQICKKLDVENIVASEHGLRHGVVHEMAVGHDSDARMDLVNDHSHLHAVNA